jgi:hypothetical protein
MSSRRLMFSLKDSLNPLLKRFARVPPNYGLYLSNCDCPAAIATILLILQPEGLISTRPRG